MSTATAIDKSWLSERLLALRVGVGAAGPVLAVTLRALLDGWLPAGDQAKKLVSLTSAGFQAAITLPASTYAVEQGDHLALGIPADGSTVALWRDVRTRTAENPTLTYAAVKSSVRPSGGAFSPTEQISPNGWLAGPPQAGTLTDRTVAAWSESRGSGARVRIAVHPVGQAWTALVPLPAPRIDTWTVSVAASSGYAAITWVQRPRSAKSGCHVPGELPALSPSRSWTRADVALSRLPLAPPPQSMCPPSFGSSYSAH